MGAPRPGQRFCASCGIYIEDELADLHRNIKSTRSGLRKVTLANLTMVGFISNLAPLNYLRRRSPGPPFPPDHRQAGERGAII